MISKKEKIELLKDAKSEQRRMDFERIKKHKKALSRSLDSYLKFLSEFQKVFSFSKTAKKNILAGFNRL